MAWGGNTYSKQPVLRRAVCLAGRACRAEVERYAKAQSEKAWCTPASTVKVVRGELDEARLGCRTWIVLCLQRRQLEDSSTGERHQI